MTNRPVMIMAGGTGGHIYPALAVANELRARQCPVFWLGTRNGLEARVIPPTHIEMEWIDIRGLRGNGLLGWLAAPYRLTRSVFQALAIIRRRNPAAVLGMGGFVSGPGGVAAFLTQRPLLIHEQNAVAGLTNRLLARLARVVLQAFPGSFSDRANVTTVGNPVRADIAALPLPAERFANRQGRLRVLVLGGSLGAKSLNENVAGAIARFAVPDMPEVWHQSGQQTEQLATAAYKNQGIAARIDAYIEDMAEAYGWADLVICRAGALTVAEVSAAGLAAIFVPYPLAVDDHQTANAREHVARGAALTISDSDLSGENLYKALLQLGTDRADLLKRAEIARLCARANALTDITAACMQLRGAADD